MRERERKRAKRKRAAVVWSIILYISAKLI